MSDSPDLYGAPPSALTILSWLLVSLIGLMFISLGAVHLSQGQPV